jgi:hypothetical protein
MQAGIQILWITVLMNFFYKGVFIFIEHEWLDI